MNNPKPQPGVPLRRAEKLARIPVKVAPRDQPPAKPKWLKVKLPTRDQAERVRRLLRDKRLNTVCEEAACPNLPECFGHGTATFMILDRVCTRRCPFCEVGDGRPLPVDAAEPQQLADAVRSMRLDYVVITSVTRDDLRDGGVGHFADCVNAVRAARPGIRIEMLTPDFRGRMNEALDALSQAAPDVFNHDVETVPRLYRQARPGAHYDWSLALLRRFAERHPDVRTKSGVMVGLGENLSEIRAVMHDLRQNGCRMLTIGQYLAPSELHLPVERYYTPEEFDELRVYAESIGFENVASGPLVRASYHADSQSGLLLGNAY